MLSLVAQRERVADPSPPPEAEYMASAVERLRSVVPVLARDDHQSPRVLAEHSMVGVHQLSVVVRRATHHWRNYALPLQVDSVVGPVKPVGLPETVLEEVQDAFASAEE